VFTESGLKPIHENSPLAGERGRAGGRHPSPRPAPVFIRLPHLTRTASGRLREFRPSTASPGEAPRETPDPTPIPHATSQLDSLPGPRRSINPVEHALRRLRHEAQPATGHTLRNLLILVAILVTATGLTIWMTQGAPAPDNTAAPTSAHRSPTKTGSPDKAWEGLDLDATGPEVEDRWARGTATALPTSPARAPAIETWPPDRGNGQFPPRRNGPFPLPSSPSGYLAGGAVDSASPAPDSRTPPDQTPVANLIHIEPAPIRR
jgi:hypothetical protein